MTTFKTLLSSLFTVLLIVVLANDAFAGGPWLLKKGKGYFQLQAHFAAYRYSQLLTGFGATKTRNINREIFYADYGFYGEYGITDKLDVMAMLPFKYADAGDLTNKETNFVGGLLEGGSINGLSNVRLGLKYGLIDKDVKLAISAQAALNTVSTEAEKGLTTGFQANAFGLMAHVGGGLGSKWYAFAEMGFMKYTDEFSDTVEGRVEIGRTLGNAFTLMLTTEVRLSFDNGSYYNENFIQTGLYPNDQQWIASSLKLNWQSAGKFGAHIGTALIPLHLTNVGFAGTFVIGAYLKI